IKRQVNPHLNLKQIRMAQVLDEMFNKVLCYEVSGTQKQDQFLIYYNANTGKEEKIRRVDKNGNEVL
ncbi:MAG TPA: germination protein YpeB, partial [Bacillota bacterium]|nr:germination protein YpeB [Bacillota bacterium]